MPWNFTYTRTGAAVVYESAGYDFITSTPDPARREALFGIQIDWARVLLELAAIAVVTGGLYVTLADPKAT